MFKYKYKTIKHGATISEVCPMCETKNSTSLKIICRINYFSVVPFWGSKKKVVFSCGSCGKLYSISKNSVYRDKADDLLKKARYPLSCFTGVIILSLALVVLLGYGSFSTNVLNKRGNSIMVVDNILNNIRPGAVIFYLSENGEKTSMIVDEISSDTLFVRKNNQTTMNNVYELDIKENYSSDQSIYTRSQIRKMNDEKIILNIY